MKWKIHETKKEICKNICVKYVVAQAFHTVLYITANATIPKCIVGHVQNTLVEVWRRQMKSKRPKPTSSGTQWTHFPMAPCRHLTRKEHTGPSVDSWVTLHGKIHATHVSYLQLWIFISVDFALLLGQVLVDLVFGDVGGGLGARHGGCRGGGYGGGGCGG